MWTQEAPERPFIRDRVDGPARPSNVSEAMDRCDVTGRRDRGASIARQGSAIGKAKARGEYVDLKRLSSLATAE